MFIFTFQISPSVQGPLTMGALADLRARPLVVADLQYRLGQLSIPNGTCHKCPIKYIQNNCTCVCVCAQNMTPNLGPQIVVVNQNQTNHVVKEIDCYTIMCYFLKNLVLFIFKSRITNKLYFCLSVHGEQFILR